jgi:hypothetical protein
MNLIGPTGNFSNSTHRGMQHHDIAGLHAQPAKPSASCSLECIKPDVPNRRRAAARATRYLRP